MTQLERFRETIATYRRHGWQLRSVLMTSETHTAIDDETKTFVDAAAVRLAEFDAVWFERPSGADRTASELRLISDAPYALFELFEADEAEEDREDVRREMEARLREQIGGRQVERSDDT